MFSLVIQNFSFLALMSTTFEIVVSSTCNLFPRQDYSVALFFNKEKAQLWLIHCIPFFGDKYLKPIFCFTLITLCYVCFQFKLGFFYQKQLLCEFFVTFSNYNPLVF